MNKSNYLRQSKIFDYVIVNGKCLAATEAQTSIFNEALLSSFGIYETVKIDQGRPFYLEEHLRRLFESARLIDLDLDVERAALSSWFDKLISIDPQATWSLRIVALGALTPDETPLIAFQARPLPTYPDSFYTGGARAVLYEGQRALPPCKSLNNLVNFLARRRATQLGALEGLLHHNGHITEGARSNAFAARRGQLITPPESMVLAGITRDIILQVIQETDISIVEEPISIELSNYDELFISSTSMHVLPITTVDNQTIGSGQVGPITKTAMAKFKEHYEQVMGEN